VLARARGPGQVNHLAQPGPFMTAMRAGQLVLVIVPSAGRLAERPQVFRDRSAMLQTSGPKRP